MGVELDLDSPQFAASVTSAPAIPGAGAGTDISALKNGGRSPRHARLRFEKDSGAGDVTLTGPVKVYGESKGVVYELGELDDGNDVVVNASAGQSYVIQFLGTYDRIAVIPAAVGGGGYNGYVDGIYEEG